MENLRPPFKIVELYAGDEFQVTAGGPARIEYRVHFGPVVEHVGNAVEAREAKIAELSARLAAAERERDDLIAELEREAHR
jgi:hypothetical protein